MPLVAYPDSDSGSESSTDASPPPQKRSPSSGHDGRAKSRDPRLPPLPPAFHDLYATTVRMSQADDPALHGGRKRAVPHTPGGWPSHVQLEWHPSGAECEALAATIAHAQQVMTRAAPGAAAAPIELRSCVVNELGTRVPLHISLSRTLVLDTRVKDAFAATLRRRVASGGVKPFSVSFASLDLVPNYQHTRWFLVLRVRRPQHDELNRLLGLANATCREHGQPQLYVEEGHQTGAGNVGGAGGRDGHACSLISNDGDEDGGRAGEGVAPSVDQSSAFHVSIAWTLREPSEEARQAVSAIDVGSRVACAVRFSSVKARIGNQVHDIPFGGSKLVGV
ncbi:poly(U)-specific 3'-to-5' RNA exonuclease [Ascosphaera acerosa]|nr:poly(U)-specific 3'-to-5' RNA exonuclease [Ascosphaera acerosa]